MEAFRQQHPSLRGAVQADVAIVGGGLTGVSTAAMLSAMGVKVVLAEAWCLGQGASRCCTGLATSQLPSGYPTIAAHAGVSVASAYSRLLRTAVSGLQQLCHRLGVPVQQQSVYVFAETLDDLPPLHALYRLESQLGLPVFYGADAGGCPFPVELSLGLERQVLLSPLAYLHALADFAAAHGCRLYEGTPVRAMAGHRLQTEAGSIQADTILLATGTPIGCTSLPRLAAIHQRSCESLLLKSPQPVMNCHLSVRPEELRLCPTADGLRLAWDMGRVGSDQRGRTLLLHRTLKALLPDMPIAAQHNRQEVYSGDGLPLIGAIHPAQSHLLMATGYGGCGILGSYLAAQVLAGQITGHPLPHAALFRPDRPMPRAQEGLRTAKAYLSGLAHRHGPVCPHMGGKLYYDVETRRWVCPCHGSAFTTLGETLCAPAMTPAEVSAKQR